MAITYTDSLEKITPQQLKGFFVNWKQKPSPQKHLQLLQKSNFCFLAINREKQVVGFITAISDGVLAAYIPFLEVLPAYQGQGIGTMLLKKMLRRLKRMYMIDLVCDQTKSAFYTKQGLQTWSAMTKRNYTHQKGI